MILALIFDNDGDSDGDDDGDGERDRENYVNSHIINKL